MVKIMLPFVHFVNYKSGHFATKLLNNRMDFYERTKYLCKERELTIETLMSRCQLTRETFFKWRERQSLPRSDSLYKMSKVLGVSMEYLLNGENTSTPPIAQAVYDYLKDNRPGELSDILMEIEKKTGMSGIRA